MGILINVIDMGLPGTGDIYRRTMADMIFQYEGEYRIRIHPPDPRGARSALTRAAELSNLHGPIKTIRIIGHGAPGIQSTGRGNWSQVDRSNPQIVNGSQTFDVLSYANIDSLYPELAVLGRCFTDDGEFQFHGCSVGGGQEGDRLLRKTAQHLGVPVLAGALVQSSATLRNISVRAHERFNARMEGPLRRALPDGTIGFYLLMGNRGYQQL